jgi:hypothetical protein
MSGYDSTVESTNLAKLNLDVDAETGTGSSTVSSSPCDFLDTSLPLFDLREESSLASTASHIIIHMPFSSIMQRCPQLPPRNVPFAVLISDQAQKEEVLEWFAVTKSKYNNSVRIQFPLAFLLVATPEFLVRIKESEPAPPSPFAPRLWVPDPLVEVVEPLLLLGSYTRLVDLGCGSSRDLTYLAERTPKGTVEFIGVDNHPGAPKRCAPLFEYHGVSPTILDVDLRKEPSWEALLNPPEGQLPTIFMSVRYLNRPLLTHFASSPTVATMTIAVSHFCRASSIADWPFDHPRPSQVLHRTELSRIFRPPQWKILHDKIVIDSDHGRTMQQFIVTRLGKSIR